MGREEVRYPWDEWLKAGSSWYLERGVDYDCLSHSMAQQVRNAALTRGVLVSISIEEDGIQVKVRKRKRKKNG